MSEDDEIESAPVRVEYDGTTDHQNPLSVDGTPIEGVKRLEFEADVDNWPPTLTLEIVSPEIDARFIEEAVELIPGAHLDRDLTWELVEPESSTLAVAWCPWREELHVRHPRGVPRESVGYEHRAYSAPKSMYTDIIGSDEPRELICEVMDYPYRVVERSD